MAENGKRKKKIVYVVEDFAVCGGVERIVSQKASILHSRYGHRVDIVTVYRDHRPQGYPLAQGINLVRLDVPFARKSRFAPLAAICRLGTITVAAARLDKALRRLNPDLVFFATTLGALLLPLCRCKAKKVFESHLARMFTPFSRFLWLTESRADLVVCLTKGDAKLFRKAKKTCVIPNFISAAGQGVLDYGAKQAVAVGRLEQQKGFDILLRCWGEASKRHPGWHLDIYGEGSQREALQSQIEALGLGGSVELKGRCADMLLRYSRYSFMAVASRYEGFPMTLIEGQASGLAAVATDFQFGASEILSDGINGLIVPQGDEKAFALALERMMASEPLRRRLGTKGREMATRFDEKPIMEQWEKLVEGICK